MKPGPTLYLSTRPFQWVHPLIWKVDVNLNLFFFKYLGNGRSWSLGTKTVIFSVSELSGGSHFQAMLGSRYSYINTFSMGTWKYSKVSPKFPPHTVLWSTFQIILSTAIKSYLFTLILSESWDVLLLNYYPYFFQCFCDITFAYACCPLLTNK